MMKTLRAASAAIALFTVASLVSGTAQATDVTLEVFHAWPSHKRFYDPIAAAFMKLHPDIKIDFLASAEDYGAAHQRVLRDAIGGSLPDVYFSAYNTLPELARTLSARGDIADLTPFLKQEGDKFIQANYAPNVLALAKVDGKQWGIPFNASTPIVYFNNSLVERAGGSVNSLPKDWDGIIALAKKMHGLGGVDGVAYEASEWGDDWLWQALVDNAGGGIVADGSGAVTFGGDAGLKGLKLLRRLETETEMPMLNEDQAIQQFAAGKLGIFIGSTAEVRTMGEGIGGKFQFTTAEYPAAEAGTGHLPAGGNAAVILSKDPERQKAAWDFVKFATGPQGQEIAVLGSGYMPTNLQASGSDFLGKFYAEHPNWTVSMKQWPIATAWFGYPGGRGTRIWSEQRTVLAQVIRGDLTPETGLKTLLSVTEQGLTQ